MRRLTPFRGAGLTICFVFLSLCLFLCQSLGAPLSVSAHEVYVLSPQTISTAVSTPSPDPLALIVSDAGEFSLWAMIGVIAVAAVFLISVSRAVERAVDPFLYRLKKWAPLIARLTLGASLLASGYYNALFGPELPLDTLFGAWGMLIRILLIVIGIAIILGLYVRAAGTIMLVIYGVAVVLLNVYMLTYLNYFGEAILCIILAGGGHMKKLERYSFAINRVCFGVAALYASWYAKLFHSNLALDTVTQYHLTSYFHFSPLFLVLGALIVESLIGIFLIVGFEIRFTALFFLFFLCLSLSFFGEAVWPHLILLGLCLTMIAHGYDEYSLEGRFLKKGRREPVL